MKNKKSILKKRNNTLKAIKFSSLLIILGVVFSFLAGYAAPQTKVEDLLQMHRLKWFL